MRTIKFRGKPPAGEIVYGDLTHDGELVFINDKRVEPDSVAQFVGHDYNGDEVYEGDILIDSMGNKYEPSIELAMYCHSGFSNYDDFNETLYGLDTREFYLKK